MLRGGSWWPCVAAIARGREAVPCSVGVLARAVLVLVAVLAPAATMLAGTSFMPHFGQRSGLSLVDLRMHRADVGDLVSRLGEQLHPALRAAARLVAHDLGVHRADVDDLTPSGTPMSISATNASVLSGGASQERLDPLA